MSPALMPPSCRARHAVTPAVGRVADSSCLHPLGAAVKAAAGPVAISCAKPSEPSPGYRAHRGENGSAGEPGRPECGDYTVTCGEVGHFITDFLYDSGTIRQWDSPVIIHSAGDGQIVVEIQ